MRLSEEIKLHCNLGLENTLERDMQYNTIWDSFIAIRDDCKKIEQLEQEKAELLEALIKVIENYHDIYRDDLNDISSMVFKKLRKKEDEIGKLIKKITRKSWSEL